jgi:hypothetical protein
MKEYWGSRGIEGNFVLDETECGCISWGYGRTGEAITPK